MTALETVRSLPQVRRAWPAKDRGLTFEQTDARGRLRAGAISADGVARLAEYASDPALPDLHPGTDAELVVHRLGRRAVLLGDEFASKLLRPGRAAPVAEASEQVRELTRGAGVTAARVLGYSSSRVDFQRLPGRSLHALGDAALPGWQRFVQAWPEVTARPAELPRHGPADEARVLTQWLAWAEEHQVLPDLAALRSAVEHTCRDLTSGDGPSSTIHRDLHDKQLLWDGANLGLLDCDTAACGEAALDVANLWAHVELRHLQGSLADPSPVLDVLAQLPHDPRRFSAYHRTTRLRLVFVYAFRPTAARWLPTWVEQTLSLGTAT
ncbi:MAG: phosphotransferase [Propionibacteriaceae bacterium]|nr:phosphotransferase [Propionibacteriaceae bacterium]